uniref:Uncharacterized protein n=1 Tax=Caenorhabditis tropicalis TaxID=1561998 RepID=A0A1I7V3U9_9PELO
MAGNQEAIYGQPNLKIGEEGELNEEMEDMPELESLIRRTPITKKKMKMRSQSKKKIQLNWKNPWKPMKKKKKKKLQDLPIHPLSLPHPHATREHYDLRKHKPASKEFMKLFSTNEAIHFNNGNVEVEKFENGHNGMEKPDIGFEKITENLDPSKIMDVIDSHTQTNHPMPCQMLLDSFKVP